MVFLQELKNQNVKDAVNAADLADTYIDWMMERHFAKYTKEELEHIQECPVCIAQLEKIKKEIFQAVLIIMTTGKKVTHD